MGTEKAFFWVVFMAGVIMASGSKISAAEIERVNLYLYPAYSSRIIARLPADVPFTIHGCLADKSWCDVSYFKHRGWVTGKFLDDSYRNGQAYVMEQGPYIPGPVRTYGYHNQGGHHHHRPRH